MSSLPLIALVVTAGWWASGAEVRVDASRGVGELRPLHGVNNGPLNFGEMVDLSAYYRELRVPLVRLHDSEWPDPSVVDVHAIFPDPSADPEDPESYIFARTDDYIDAIVRTGAGIVYRLGESIEHSRRKYRVQPPADAERWAAVCVGIIRHYNEGWADGFRHGIPYWEIWNEPENRPAMWTGSDEDYYRLYEVASKKVKARFPALRVGGPSVGATGEVVDGRLQATAFLEGFLERCRAREAPLDFFSWHTYTNDPGVYARKARAIRQWLDERGFQKTEIHLNEWNYLPDNDWEPMSVAGQGVRRERWYARMGGAEGAAFVASVLVSLLDAPVDVVNLYSGDSLPFGLFTRDGVPKKSYHAVRAFAELAHAGTRLHAAAPTDADWTACAATNRERSEVLVLLARPRFPEAEAEPGGETRIELSVENLPWNGETSWETSLLDATRALEPVASGRHLGRTVRIAVPLPSPAVVSVRLRPEKGG